MPFQQALPALHKMSFNYNVYGWSKKQSWLRTKINRERELSWQWQLRKCQFISQRKIEIKIIANILRMLLMSDAISSG